jgi:hypothetical protein
VFRHNIDNIMIDELCFVLHCERTPHAQMAKMKDGDLDGDEDHADGKYS